jgi:hypothetical protein
MTTTEPLTEREQQALGQMREAQGKHFGNRVLQTMPGC